MENTLKINKNNQVIGKELSRIYKERGVLNPRVVLDEARPETSPLHRYFDWDDSSAAENWRTWQARYYITRVTVTIKDKEVQAYHNVSVKMKGEKVRGYFSTKDIVNKEELKKEVLRKALSEIKYWEEKYTDIQELVGVVDNKRISSIEKSLGS